MKTESGYCVKTIGRDTLARHSWIMFRSKDPGPQTLGPVQLAKMPQCDSELIVTPIVLIACRYLISVMDDTCDGAPLGDTIGLRQQP